MVDLEESLTFGYILEVPIIGKQDVMPLYRVYNVGSFKEGPRLLYRIPLPAYFVIHLLQNIIPLKMEFCEKVTGLVFCSSAVLELARKSSNCLKLVMEPTSAKSPERGHPDNGFLNRVINYSVREKCRGEIFVNLASWEEVEVMQTPSCSLTWSYREPRIFSTDPGKVKKNDIMVYE